MLTVIKSGAVVNFLAVALGSVLGLLLKRGISKRLCDAIMIAMALSVLYIGISGIIAKDINALVVVISMAVGTAVGELLDLDKHINNFCEKLTKNFKNRDYAVSPAQGMVTATMIFCIGAMTVVGSIESGINGNNATLYSKAMIDGITSVALASTLGVGVMFSAVPVLVIEGVLTLAASYVGPFLNTRMVSHISVIGSLLIIAIGLNMLKITKIKVMNLMPAVFLPLVLCLFM